VLAVTAAAAAVKVACAVVAAVLVAATAAAAAAAARLVAPASAAARLVAAAADAVVLVAAAAAGRLHPTKVMLLRSTCRAQVFSAKACVGTDCRSKFSVRVQSLSLVGLSVSADRLPYFRIVCC
jgi:hypothetical protein